MTMKSLNRRDFLKAAGLAVTATALAACAPAATPTAAPAEVKPTEAPKAEAPKATEAPKAEAPTAAPAANTVSGSILVMGPKGELPDKDFAGFKAKYPDVKVEQAEMDKAKFKAMIAAGTMPDVIRSDGADLQSLLLRDIPLDLTDYFKAGTVIKMDDFAPSCEYYHVNGKWYGLPKDWSPDFSFYMNTNMAKDAGVTLPPFDKSIKYTDVFDMGRKLTKKEGDRTLQVGYAYELSFFARQIMSILLEEDKYLYNDDFSKVIIKDNPLVVEILKGFADISKEGITWNPLNPCKTWPGQEFISGTEAMVGYGYWFNALVNDPGKDAKVNGTMAAFFPAPTWTGKKTVSPTIGGSGYIGGKGSKYPDAAWAFLEYYLGDQPAVDRAKTGWGVPALKSLYPLMPTGNPFQKQVQDVLQYTFKNGDASYALKFNPYYADQVFDDSWYKNLEAYLKGSASFDQLVANLEKEVNAAIEDGKSSA